MKDDPPGFPSTRFLTALFRADPERIRNMNPTIVSQYYGIPEQWVREWVERELVKRRGDA